MDTLLQMKVTHLPYLDSVSLFELVAHEPWAMFLDSGSDDASRTASSRFDVLLTEPQATLVFDGDLTTFTVNGREQVLHGDPLAILQSAIPECKAPHQDSYLPGAYGYLSYDLARQYEKLPETAVDDEGLPQMAMGIYHVVLVIDHELKKSRVVRIGESNAAKAMEKRWLDLVLVHQESLVEREIAQLTNDSLGIEEPPSKVVTLNATKLKESFDWTAYKKAFARIRDYTLDGDCYQVNLTKRFEAEVDDQSWDAYKSLRASSAAPYGCYINLPFAQILSNSPESFIKCRDHKVTTSPIKGTRRRRLDDEKADKLVAKSLHESEKDRAENLMIVDLMRNDLGRACLPGSIEVTELFSLHSFANVHHLISTVIGTLRPELHAIDLLRCCFPGGSITGAPKVRSMQIIEELEPNRRGLYCGSIGYIGANGDAETNIAIRTIVIKDGIARFSAGGALVIDSNVEDEYQELNDKISILMSAVMSGTQIGTQ